MLKHNSYFEGAVQSVGYTRNGLPASVGVIAPGEKLTNRGLTYAATQIGRAHV